ncbi:macrophage mannose receptor 1-like [Xyrichtys novacula]|uniref:Macrophage mannose receptor 1-like n=1 Tax=Xyrichtys novacula TaxID=13765 RepID=A0AAV1HPS0_XYRNO|nr:macrophage mannose receptor 1-like [Xyrichtys novacula]
MVLVISFHHWENFGYGVPRLYASAKVCCCVSVSLSFFFRVVTAEPPHPQHASTPSGFVSCASLAVKILELEGRISTLYKIQEAEKHLEKHLDTGTGYSSNQHNLTQVVVWSQIPPLLLLLLCSPLLQNLLSPLTVLPENQHLLLSLSPLTVPLLLHSPSSMTPGPGWHFISCPAYQYHFVSEAETWTKAQAICREKYTDLATAKNTEEMNQLIATVSSHGYNNLVWIGLYTKIDWKWSDGYTASGNQYMNWENIDDDEPDFRSGAQFCGDIEDYGKWWDANCLDELHFVCYTGTPQNAEFVFVEEKKSWFDAQRFCRENYVDLATVRNSTENQRLHDTRPNSEWAWIGLYRAPNLHWSDGTYSTLPHWESGGNPLGFLPVICGAASMWREGKWWALPCVKKYPFVCHTSDWHLTACLPHQYHFVSEAKTWTNAQTFCRETYTDLVTVKNTEEMNQLIATVSSYGYDSSFWIGVSSMIEWKWSDGYTASGDEYMNWQNIKNNEPDFALVSQLCVDVTHDGRWWDDNCYQELHFVCNTDTPQDSGYVFVKEEKIWSEAQRFCRDNYKDLATVRNSTENQRLQSLIPEDDYPWIGLHRDTNLHWSDGSDSSFQFWDYGATSLGSMSVVCGAAVVWRSGQWWALPCEEKHPFVCYTSELAKQVITQEIKTGDPSKNLSDPAVRADILGELQSWLKENGPSGVPLKWEEQPD